MIVLVSLFGLIGCLMKKKEKKENLESWLETNFPGQLQIDRSLRDFHPKHFYEKKVTSLISDINDPEVQLELVWYKDDPNLGLVTEDVSATYEARKAEKAKAMAWLSKMKEAGLQKVSVGVIEMALYVMPYGEPTPEARKNTLQQIFSVLQKENSSDQTSIWVEWMEDSAYQKEIKDIIPFGYWRRKDSYHDDNKLFSVDFEWKDGLEASVVNTGWEFNGKSNRSMEFLKQAYVDARKWADTHGEKSSYVEPTQMVSYEVDGENPLTIHYSFPLHKTMPDTTIVDRPDTDEYITGVFDVDKRTFTDIQKVKEE